ncbi:protein lifeguard 1-like isoform X2 [Suricata suricatta]|uniref:protein lifeguard 1-like isoform X2 n=1 Tax=Suricata suricatta TaxID=37032 RepID=UPI001155740E|nr:protein lifeguard 1-like isoform X2 [Suricata suricatta]
MKMDLEVSEPIDFSCGDHQHLVRKAADSNIQTKSSHSTNSSSSESQRTQEEPRSETKERLDSYVVQISEDPAPEVNNSISNLFSDSSIRRAFIIKVFLILTAQLVVTGAIISVFISWKGLRTWVLMNAWFTYAILPAFFVVLIVLACCGDLRRKVPVNYILLGLFWDFTMLNGMLFVLLFVLIIYGTLLLFIRSYWFHVLYAGLGTVLFSLYLVMDVQLMVGGHHPHADLHPEEYVFAALNIYLDIINLFLFILQLIGLAR